MLKKIKQSLKAHQNPNRAKNPLFYKTGPGDYAEHDQFIGVSTPHLRKTAKQYFALSLTEIQPLLHSKINEERLLALFILVDQYQQGSSIEQEKIYQFYMDNINHVNNWNLVDASAHLIVGAHLVKKSRKLLSTLAASNHLWERRIAIVSTWCFIKNNDFNTTIKIAKQLLQDKHDLIHKATGWMLREVGKKDEALLVAFLTEHAHQMPRTMLRYAIEKLKPKDKKHFLKK